MPRHPAISEYLLKSLLLLCAWTLLGLLGMISYEYFGGTSPLWPASGLGLALLLLWGPRYWPAIALGSLLVSISGQVPPLIYVPLALANALESAGSAWVLRRLAFDSTMSRPREVVRLALVSMPFCIVSALVGVTVLRSTGAIHADEALLKGTVWVLGNFLGAVLVAPAVLVWSQPLPATGPRGPVRALEIGALSAVLGVMCALVFFRGATPAASMPLAFLTVPLVMMASLRFGLRGGTLAAVLVCGLAVLGTSLHLGVFEAPDPRTSTAMLMLFSGMLVLTALFVGSTITDQRRHAEELRYSESVFQSLAETNQLLLASTDWRACAPQVLQALGQGLRLHRLAIYQYFSDDEGRGTAVSLHRWETSGPGARTGLLLSQATITNTPSLRRWVDELQAGRIVTATAPLTPEEDRALFARFGVQCIMAAPIMIDGRAWGFISFSACGARHDWTAEERAIAQACATNFSIAIRRDQLRQELADSLTRQRALLNALPDAFFLHDAHGTFLDFHINDLSAAWLPPEKFAGRTHHEVFPPDVAALIEQGFAELNTTGKPVVLHYSLSLPGGERHFERRLVRADQGRVMSIVRDITDQKLADQERDRFEQKLRETQRLESLGVLAGGIAHDFNNLLTAVLGNVSLARLTLPPGSEVAPMLQQIEAASRRAADLCRQMLAYAGRGNLVIDRADLTQLVRDTASLLQLSLSQRARLELDLCAQPLPVLADVTQIRQVLMNLIINAAEAMGPHGGQVTLSTGTMTADASYLASSRSAGDVQPGAFCYIEVADTGSGMTPETLARIFDPFFTTKFTGRGLGLAAVLGIVQGHRGALHVASQPGAGSTFRVLLPLAEESPAPPALPDEKPAPAPRRTGRALVIDDEVQVRDTAALMLERLGYSVLAVDGGAAALAALQAAPGAFKFALLDLTMPGMDGRETLSALRTLRPDLPVIVMSGYDEQESTHRLQGGQVQGFLPKPFTFESLQTRLTRVRL